MKLRFFCEQCGTEVPRNTERCPACGRYFTAIQCPQCGFQGSESDFASGCPTCGYMRSSGQGPAAAQGGGRSRRRGGGARSRRGAAARRKARAGAGTGVDGGGGPPPAVYKIMGLVLLALLGVLVAVLLLL
jgi:hypothetical protein